MTEVIVRETFSEMYNTVLGYQSRNCPIKNELSIKMIRFKMIRVAKLLSSVICLLQLLGCGILGVGIWLHIAKGSYASVTPSVNFLSVTALCIAAGLIVLVVGFFGCGGAIMENQCMLLTVSASGPINPSLTITYLYCPAKLHVNQNIFKVSLSYIKGQ